LYLNLRWPALTVDFFYNELDYSHSYRFVNNVFYNFPLYNESLTHFIT
jgi:hypothetical protein